MKVLLAMFAILLALSACGPPEEEPPFVYDHRAAILAAVPNHIFPEPVKRPEEDKYTQIRLVSKGGVFANAANPSNFILTKGAGASTKAEFTGLNRANNDSVLLQLRVHDQALLSTSGEVFDICYRDPTWPPSLGGTPTCLVNAIWIGPRPW